MVRLSRKFEPKALQQVAKIACAVAIVLATLILCMRPTNCYEPTLLDVSKPAQVSTDIDVETPSKPVLRTDMYNQNSNYEQLERFLDSVAGNYPTSCQEVQAKVDSGEWEDPNKGRFYARKIVSKPHFMVSVHKQEYDPLRWRTIFNQGDYYEQEVYNRFLRILKDKKPQLVLDVGMNIGYYTHLTAALGHPVIAFEINPANVIRSCESVHLNSANGPKTAPVAIVRHGVSNVHGQTLQVFVPKNPGQGRMEQVDSDGKDAADGSLVTTITLDRFAQDNGWFSRKDLSVALLKLDVEGHEPQIIMGAKKLLGSGIVQNILTELTVPHLKERHEKYPVAMESLEIIMKSGYRLKMKDQTFTDSSAAGMKTMVEALHAEGQVINNGHIDVWFERV